MHPSARYFMCDQVRGFVPDLMAGARPNRQSRIRAALELAVFLLAALSYLVALALAA